MEVGPASRQHERDRLTRRKAPLLEPERERRSPPQQVRVGHRLLGRLVEDQVPSLGVGLHVPPQHVEQALGPLGKARRLASFGKGGGLRPDRVLSRRAKDGLHQVSRRFGGKEDRIGQTHVELPLDPQEQLASIQAVQAEIPVQGAVQHQALRAPARVQLEGEPPRRLEQLVGDGGGGEVRARCHGPSRMRRGHGTENPRLRPACSIALKRRKQRNSARLMSSNPVIKTKTA
ncbi:hypothetical protein D3C86_1306550 [compost metagenome]